MSGSGIRACAIGAALVCIAVPAQAEVWKDIYPIEGAQTATLADEGVTVTVQAPPPWPDDADERDPAIDYADPVITVTFPGMEAVKVPHDPRRSAAFGISIGIARLKPTDARPTVFISGFSGGAHCCGTLQLVSAVADQPVIDALPLRDGEPMAALPEDIDGDGTRDIRWADDSLLYEFASYASSWPVPRIYDLHDGLARDVSREARFAAIYREFTAEALDACQDAEYDNRGSCAAYAHGMAILGRAEEGIATAARSARTEGPLPTGCLVEYGANGECPQGSEVTFDDFESALRWIMKRNGYLD